MRHQPSLHVCHALRCSMPVEPRLMMCKRHWEMVPKTLQQAVWEHYRQGQERDKQPSIQYLLAQRAALRYVATAEQLEIPVWLSERMDARLSR